jgi:hypothetical protein
MCNLESRSATFAGQRNRKFPVVFPVSREFGRVPSNWVQELTPGVQFPLRAIAPILGQF